MRQYNSIKSKHPDALLLFRVGDFYETFSQDAIKASEILGITLTKRANGSASSIELAGFPYHALNNYLPKLVRAGLRVAVCDQLESPTATRKIVKRGVTELVTPGVTLTTTESKENNFLASIHIEKQVAGIALLDITTGEFFLAEGERNYIKRLLNSFNPKEVLFKRGLLDSFPGLVDNAFFQYPLEDWVYGKDTANKRLTRHFGTTNLKGFGIQEYGVGIKAAGAILYYMDLTEHNQISHIHTLSRIDPQDNVWLDKFTVRNLELISSITAEGKCLVDVMDQTVSPMGGRLLRRWVLFPLNDVGKILARQEAVKYLVEDKQLLETLREELRKIGDMERLLSKIAMSRVSPRELLGLVRALEKLKPIREACKESKSKLLKKLGNGIATCTSLHKRLQTELHPEAPAAIGKGDVMANGVNEELDDLRSTLRSGQGYLSDLQQREAKETGISSLKVGFNNVFGYYLEVRSVHKNKVPENWIRKQTLVSAERYITEELKEYEQKILGAEEKILTIETQLFNELLSYVMEFLDVLSSNSQHAAQIDVLCSFADIALSNKYTCPEINNGDAINIKGGRHPVIEAQLPIGEEYVSNDILLNKEQQIIIITGPNMAGKSALLRQTAIIVLMAQMGAFVPAEKACIGCVDKVFTRVGASDNISQGESTFMVEMNEAAGILNNLSKRSLVLFDELGRGTSTYDGVSIAWAVVEYIHETQLAKTLFATHYHELNEMQALFPRIKNFNVAVKRIDEKIIFLRKLEMGGSNHSFGIHVAAMAGMPNAILERAKKLLVALEKGHDSEHLAGAANKQITPLPSIENENEMQLSFFQVADSTLNRIREQLERIDINNLTPLEALNLLNEIKNTIS